MIKEKKWVSMIAVIALVFAVVAVVIIFGNGMTGEAIKPFGQGRIATPPIYMCVNDENSYIVLNGAGSDGMFQSGEDVKAKLCMDYSAIAEKSTSQKIAVKFEECFHGISGCSQLGTKDLNIIVGRSGITEGKICTDWAQNFNAQNNQYVKATYVLYGNEKIITRDVLYDDSFPDIDLRDIKLDMDGCEHKNPICDPLEGDNIKPIPKVEYVIRNNPECDTRARLKATVYYKYAGTDEWTMLDSEIRNSDCDQGQSTSTFNNMKRLKLENIPDSGIRLDFYVEVEVIETGESKLGRWSFFVEGGSQH